VTREEGNAEKTNVIIEKAGKVCNGKISWKDCQHRHFKPWLEASLRPWGLLKAWGVIQVEHRNFLEVLTVDFQNFRFTLGFKHPSMPVHLLFGSFVFHYALSWDTSYNLTPIAVCYYQQSQCSLWCLLWWMHTMIQFLLLRETRLSSVVHDAHTYWAPGPEIAIKNVLFPYIIWVL
jgi:hypothetical protein